MMSILPRKLYIIIGSTLNFPIRDYYYIIPFPQVPSWNHLRYTIWYACLASINAFSQCAELFVGNPENRKINSWKCYAIIQFYSASAFIFSASPELSKERRIRGVCGGKGSICFDWSAWRGLLKFQLHAKRLIMLISRNTNRLYIKLCRALNASVYPRDS